MKSILISAICSSLLVPNFLTVYADEEEYGGEEIIIENYDLNENAPTLENNYSINEIPVYEEGSDAYGIEVEYHSIEKIREYYAKHPIHYLTASYISEPDYSTAPYAPGELSPSVLDDALTTLNLIRYIAGLDYDVTLNSEYTSMLQAGSLINAVNDSLEHKPSQPAGMDDDLYRLGYAGNASANIAKGYSSLGKAITDGWLGDSDSSNIAKLGHRRWLLNAQMAETGFGQVGSYSGMYAHDAERESPRSSSVWPAQNTPIEFFKATDAWSISTGNIEDISKIQVKMENTSTHEKRIITSSSGGYFNVNNENYGCPGALIWRPDNFTVSDGDSYEITITGLTVGTVYYTVTFFKLDYSDEQLVLTPSELSMENGETATVTASFIPVTSTDSLYSYRNFNPDVVAVSVRTPVFTIKALKPGTSTLRVTSAAGNRAYCYITVKGIVLSSDTLELNEGAQAQLSAEIFPSNPDQIYTWTSSDDSVAVVDNGLVTGVNGGTAVITASAEGYEASCTVTVNNVTHPVTGITVTPSSLELNPGKSANLTATITPENADNKKVNWSSSDDTVATVDENGKVTAVKIGSAVITATSEDGGYTATSTVNITAAPLTLNSASLELEGYIIVDFNYTIPKSELDSTYIHMMMNDKDTVIAAKDGRLISQTEESATYEYGIKTAPKEIGDTITVTAQDKEGNLKKTLTKSGVDVTEGQDYSVARYIKNKSTGTGALSELVKALDDFGKYAQYAFKYKTEEITEQPREVRKMVNVDELQKYAYIKEGSCEGIKLGTGYLELESDTRIDIAYDLTGDKEISEYEITVNGTEYEPKADSSKEGRYYITIADIAAKDLDEVKEISVTDGTSTLTLKYSALSYAASVLKKGTATEQTLNLAAALYLYYDAAEKYFAEKN